LRNVVEESDPQSDGRRGSISPQTAVSALPYGAATR
jgi:hypothetical protein